jgi:hypothetical protein
LTNSAEERSCPWTEEYDGALCASLLKWAKSNRPAVIPAGVTPSSWDKREGTGRSSKQIDVHSLVPFARKWACQLRSGCEVYLCGGEPATNPGGRVAIGIQAKLILTLCCSQVCFVFSLPFFRSFKLSLPMPKTFASVALPQGLGRFEILLHHGYQSLVIQSHLPDWLSCAVSLSSTA